MASGDLQFDRGGVIKVSRGGAVFWGPDAQLVVV